MKLCGNAWAGFVGQASCHGPEGGQALCFLNCCIVAVPWLEFFGYGSLLWNIFWLLDLARFTYNPLAPERLWGLPLKRLYHCCAWPIACLIAINPDLSRLDTKRCRQASIVMMPCLLRHGSIKQDVPSIHIAGLAVALLAVLVVARRYAATGDAAAGGPRQALAGVRPYLRRQWRHAACLAICWIAILVDSCRTCEDDLSSYISAVFFAGLGFFLSCDRVLTACQVRHRRRACSTRGAQHAHHAHQATTTTLSDTASTPFTPGVSEAGAGESEEYRLLDMDTLIGRIVVFFERGQEKLKVLSSNGCLQSKLELLANLDEDLHHSGCHDAFWAMAPSTFAYLRCLWNVDEEKIRDQLMQSQSDLEACIIRTASKSGSSLLTAPDGRTFVLKTMSDEDCRNLQSLLPAYRHHFERNPSSLLCRVYGCFSLRNSLGSRLYVVLMECLSASPPGSSSDALPTFTFDIKSEFQDGGFCFYFPRGLRALAEDCGLSEASVQADYLFLAGVGVVDYSVLLTLWRPGAAGRGAGTAGYLAVSWEEPGGHAEQKSSGAQSSTSKLAVARLGIIDFFQTYNTRKLAESVLKRNLLHPLHPEQRVTIVHPQLYADRQLEFVSKRVLTWTPMVGRMAEDLT